ncbi:MAG: hypothetical protein IT436_06760 [Phycisphaerales bacterium]|nr:hypothetical protein [Phycisphaerales bacterium]
MTLPRRLFIAFLLICAVGVVCWVVLPRYGVWAPPEIVILGYLLIVVSCVFVAAPKDDEEDEDDGGDGPTEDPDIAGRIGPGA